jgi:hypothetical protein
VVFDYHLLHLRFHHFRQKDTKIYPKHNYIKGLGSKLILAINLLPSWQNPERRRDSYAFYVGSGAKMEIQAKEW